MEGEKKYLTVIMPALNEEPHILQAINNVLEAFTFYNINGEIIVVNDGSKDTTAEIVKNEIIKRPDKMRIINHDAPKGIGASFWDGVDNAAADIVVMLPGDNENDPLEIFRYYKLLDHVDIVIPFIFNREIRPIFRNVLSCIYRFIINTTFLVNLNYTNGTVIYRKSMLKELDHRANSFFFQTDILIRLLKRGYLFAEVPYELGTRKQGVSKAISFPSLFQVIKGYLKLVKDGYKGGTIRAENFSGDSQTAIRRKINV